LGESCKPQARHVDVLLAIDTSSSMLEPTSAGRTKLDAARVAAETFLDQLQLPSDQAGVAWFNAAAGLAAPLTGDRAVLRRALTGLSTAALTRIDLGVGVAHAELTGPRHVPGHGMVMIVLTDGRANPGPATTAVAAAARAKADGVTLFTVGLGGDLDEAALAEMAGPCRDTPGCSYFFHASDAETLAEVYRRIAGVIPCGPEAYWGRR
jgi:Mg-chelatase subunit ChlD